MCRDDVAYAGTGNPKEGASYEPAPGQPIAYGAAPTCALHAKLVNGSLWVQGVLPQEYAWSACKLAKLLCC